MQIRIFYPELDHPAFGIMRAIAKDGTDTETGSSGIVFLDSDNMVSLVHNSSDWWQCMPTNLDAFCREPLLWPLMQDDHHRQGTSALHRVKTFKTSSMTVQLCLRTMLLCRWGS